MQPLKRIPPMPETRILAAALPAKRPEVTKISDNE